MKKFHISLKNIHQVDLEFYVTLFNIIYVLGEIKRVFNRKIIVNEYKF